MISAIGNVLVLYTFFVSAAFCAAYHITARWWDSQFGRSLMTYQVSMTAVLGLALPRIFVGADTVLYSWLRIIVFFGVPLALTWRLAVLIRTQRKARKESNGA